MGHLKSPMLSRLLPDWSHRSDGRDMGTASTMSPQTSQSCRSVFASSWLALNPITYGNTRMGPGAWGSVLGENEVKAGIHEEEEGVADQ